MFGNSRGHAKHQNKCRSDIPTGSIDPAFRVTTQIGKGFKTFKTNTWRFTCSVHTSPQVTPYVIPMVPLANASLFRDHRHLANTSKDLQEWWVLIKHGGTHRMDGAIEEGWMDGWMMYPADSELVESHRAGSVCQTFQEQYFHMPIRDHCLLHSDNTAWVFWKTKDKPCSKLSAQSGVGDWDLHLSCPPFLPKMGAV